MRRAVLLLAAGALTGCGGAQAQPAAAPVATAAVVRGPLSAAISAPGTLTYRARPDGAAYRVVGRRAGTVTALPAPGDTVRCGGVLFGVDDRPVVLLCGPLAAYRALRLGSRGDDVRELNRALGRPAGRRFTAATRRRLQAFQRRRGMRATGRLALGDAVVLPEAVRIARIPGQVGEPARPGALVLEATSSRLEVRVGLPPAQASAVVKGSRARITLPGARPVTGRVSGVGSISVPQDGPDRAAAATIPTTIALDHPRQARGLDQAPVQVDITAGGVADALSVPVTALVGRAGGGFAVEQVGPDEGRELVQVEIGLFDTAGGRVQVTGPLRAGDRVVVASP